MRLQLQPVTQKEAFAFVRDHHRHHGAPAGSLFQVAANDGEKIVGVAIAGRPVARGFDDGYTVEVIRCCTDGTDNVCSMLYRALWRAARALGYRRLITYTLKSESGGSLRASGFRVLHEVRGRSWDTPSRRRYDKQPTQDKIAWVID